MNEIVISTFHEHKNVQSTQSETASAALSIHLTEQNSLKLWQNKQLDDTGILGDTDSRFIVEDIWTHTKKTPLMGIQ